MRKAMVTLVIGQPYATLWRARAMPSWERFAERHGYELIAIEQPIDDSPLAGQRSAAWQKLLIWRHPRVAEFDRVLWLDADIVINDSVAPCPVEQTPAELVGAVQDQSMLSQPAMASAFARLNNWQKTPRELARGYYEGNGFKPPADYFINSGVLVLGRSHRDLLEHVYHHHEQTRVSYYEQIALSYEILSRGLHHAIDPRFNHLWIEHQILSYPFAGWGDAIKALCMAAAFDNCFFLHFARRLDDMARFDERVRAGKDGLAMPGDFLRRMSGEWSALAVRFEQDVKRP